MQNLRQKSRSVVALDSKNRKTIASENSAALDELNTKTPKYKNEK